MFEKINHPDFQEQEVKCPHCHQKDSVVDVIGMIAYEEYPKRCSHCDVNYFIEYEYFDNENPEEFVDNLIVRASSKEQIYHAKS